MSSGMRANFLAGEWRPARLGARSAGSAEGTGDDWPQSGPEDVALAAEGARAGGRAWSRLARARRADLVVGLARELQRDEELLARLGLRFGVEPRRLEVHTCALESSVRELVRRDPAGGPGLAWCAHDWRELVRAPLLDMARELLGGRTVVLVSDARVPELAEHVARAALAVELPPGVLGVLHGARRELLALGLGLADSEGGVLLASGLTDHMQELRHLEQRTRVEARLRALRTGAFEVDAARAPEESAAEVLERAFGRGVLGGQLPGALGRVYCPARQLSRFTELFLAALEESECAREPLALLGEDLRARARAALELGLDEGATCIAGGDSAGVTSAFAPTVFTNVESYMASARRQDPLPVLCLLRGA